MKKLTFIFLMLLLCTFMANAQTRLVKGTVLSSLDNTPLIGASIVVSGTTLGTITDLDGNFSFEIPANAKELVVSYIGYLAEKIDPTGKSEFAISLTPDLSTLDEVVVVGYGQQKKREITGSIASVKGDEIASLAAPSFESQLAGRSAGVQITTSSGIIGEAPRIRIRGIGSISQGTYPLIVVDGVPIFTGDLGGYASNNALGDINPADIESIEILKDGSATAIYGSRAANGVILITTKKGNKGKLNMSYNNYFGVATPVKTFDLLNAEEFVTITNEKRKNANLSDIAVGTDVDTDWQKAVLRQNAFQQDHNLALSGGSDRNNYYFSMGYTTQEGVALPNEMSRYTFRANVEQKATKWLSIGTNASVSRADYSGLNTGTNALSGNITSAIRQLPNTPIYDPDDPTGYNIDDINKNYVGRWKNLQSIDDNYPNIKYTLDKNKYKTKDLRIIGNAFAVADILPSLKFKTQLSVDNVVAEGLLYWNPLHGDGQSSNGRVQNNYQNLTRWNLQNILTFNKTFLEFHNLGLVLVNEFQKQNNNSFFGYGTDLSNEFFSENLISGSYGTQLSGGSLTQNGFTSYAAKLNYNYAGKYFFQASIRRDGISSLPKNNRYGTFPGASVGWTISKESFMSALTFISDLKVRASYAEVGNTDIGNYPYLGLYGGAKYADYNGLAFVQIGNDQLKWETSKKSDVGFDLGVLDNKYRLTFDYYINNQDGLILGVPTPNSFGIPGNQIAKNIGSIKNWGYEFSIEANIVRTNDLNISLDGNLTLADSKVNTLVNHQDIFTSYFQSIPYAIIREGESRIALYGYDFQGVNTANGNPIYRKPDNTLVQGDITSSTYKVYNPDNPGDLSTAATLTSVDRKVLGNALPTYFGSFGLKATYKGIDLSMMFRYSGGNKVMNRTRMDLLNQKFQNNGKEILGRWQSANAPGDGWTPKLWYGKDPFVNLTDNTSTRWVEDGDFLKMQNITIGYTLPESLVKRAGIKSLRIFVQAQDVFCLSNYTGIDPEMESGGVDYNGTPRQRVITAGLNLNL